MNQKTPEDPLAKLGPKTADRLRQFLADYNAEEDALDGMEKQYRRATGMVQPVMDASPEPYEGVAPKK